MQSIVVTSLHDLFDLAQLTGILQSERAKINLFLEYLNAEIDPRFGKISPVISRPKTLYIKYNQKGARAYNKSNKNINSYVLLCRLFINHSYTYLNPTRYYTIDNYMMIALKSQKIIRITSVLQQSYIRKKELD